MRDSRERERKSYVGTDSPGIISKKWPLCSPAPGLLLADEAPTCYRNSKQKYKMCSTRPLWLMSTSNGFLVVDGGSGLWIISVYGTPIPIGTADQVNSYLREAAITVA